MQPAKALVTSDHAGLQKRDSVMSVLTVCQRQLESELLLVKNELHLSVEDHGKVSGRAKVLRWLRERLGIEHTGQIGAEIRSGTSAGCDTHYVDCRQ